MCVRLVFSFYTSQKKLKGDFLTEALSGLLAYIHTKATVSSAECWSFGLCYDFVVLSGVQTF